MQAILRIYNLHVRRDNKYKARIKILVKDLTPEVFGQQVEAVAFVRGDPVWVLDDVAGFVTLLGEPGLCQCHADS